MRTPYLLAILLAFAPASTGASMNKATITLSPNKPAKKAPAAESHTLKQHTAFVAQGSYSGLRLTFRKALKKENYLELVLFIPSHAKFGIGYDSRKGAYALDILKLPFELDAKDTAGVTDRRKRPRPLKLTLTRWKRASSDSWSTDGTEYSACTVKVEAMSVKDQTLTFRGSFTCAAPKKGRKADGEISIEGAKLGVSKVD